METPFALHVVSDGFPSLQGVKRSKDALFGVSNLRSKQSGCRGDLRRHDVHNVTVMDYELYVLVGIK